ncbi:MAG: glutamate synthase [Anaeroplasmataceae bacterium]
MIIDATNLDYKDLNNQIKASKKDVEIKGCLGHRYIGCGLSDISIKITDGIPGNALGAYLDGATITVLGNAQDAVGDTMNAGKIIINGNIGDTAGYAMRGGEIYVKGNAGYRAGIHMKAYEDHLPVMVIGGGAGSFLGEYQAGGIIIILGLTSKEIIGDFPCTGMHGGKMFIRGNCSNVKFPSQVNVTPASNDDMKEILKYIDNFCSFFGYNKDEILNEKFMVVTPDSKNPYKQLYVSN